jgi:hypothetical protein
MNDQADYLSRIVDYDDWCIVQSLFDEISNEWGPYHIDFFACDYNAKFEKNYSRFWNPLSFAVNAFTLNWKEWNAWIVPPIYLILRVLVYQYLFICRGFGTLVVPLLESSVFFSLF